VGPYSHYSANGEKAEKIEGECHGQSSSFGDCKFTQPALEEVPAFYVLGSCDFPELTVSAKVAKQIKIRAPKNRDDAIKCVSPCAHHDAQDEVCYYREVDAAETVKKRGACNAKTQRCEAHDPPAAFFAGQEESRRDQEWFLAHTSLKIRAGAHFVGSGAALALFAIF